MQYKDVIEINGQKLTKKYIASLNREQREAWIIPMFEYFRSLGWLLPDFDPDTLKNSYKKLIEYAPYTSINEAYNNSSLANDICMYFCRKSFYSVTERKGGKIRPTLIDNFLDDNKLKKMCRNRLGLEWYDEEGQRGEVFNITPKMLMYQAQRSMRLIPQITIFKPGIAKLIYLKYTKENDLVYDFSAGFGSRVLGALSCNRRYIGVDPLTIPEIREMLKFLNVPSDRYELINGVSENYVGLENSVDFAFSSPPYYDQEFYSNDSTQAYNHGEDYFYNTYWRNTLKNIKFMLRQDKLFALNLSKKYPKMFEIAKEYFGDPIEIFSLRTVRSHLNKTGKSDAQKYEPIYIFKNSTKLLSNLPNTPNLIFELDI